MPMIASLFQSSLKKDAAYVYMGFLLRYASLLILIPYYSHVLGPENYGQVLAAMSLMGIVWLVVNFGFSIPGIRGLASAQNQIEQSRTLSRQLFGRLLMIPFGVMVGVIGTLASHMLAAHIWFGVL